MSAFSLDGNATYIGREQRRSRRLPLPMPISVQLGGETRAAFCRDIGPDNLGIEIPGVQPRVGDRIQVQLWVGGRTLDASAWVLRNGRVTGLRCPDVRPIYEILLKPAEQS